MNTIEILLELEYTTGLFPREALTAAIQNKQDIVPGLIEFINRAKDHATEIQKESEKTFMGHIYALYLLAQFREKAAYTPIVELFGSVPGEIIHDITGDLITEGLCRILASVCKGDTGLIRTLAENPNADEFVRGACIRSYVIMVASGQTPRSEAVKYFSHLFKGGLERQPSQVWNNLVAEATDINPVEVYNEIEKADQEGLFETGYISMEEIEKEKGRSIDFSMKSILAQGSRTLIEDTIAEMEWWDCFKNKTKSRILQPNIDKDFLLPHTKEAPEKLIPVRTGEKIGRNDPCTCGSGKKYKKCCGMEK